MHIDLQGRAVLPPSHPVEQLDAGIAWWIETARIALTPPSKLKREREQQQGR
jgi:hypothetical protein